MIAVIFEVWPKPEHKTEYLDLAAELRPILETIDGFISVERFESLLGRLRIREPEKIRRGIDLMRASVDTAGLLSLCRRPS